MKIEKFYLFLLACFVAIGAYSQDGQQKMTGDEKSQQQSDAKVKITGQVFDESGEGIPGANVTLKSNPTSGTVTDLDGKFILMASPQKDVLVVSFIGYNTQEFPLKGKTNVTIQLSQNVNELGCGGNCGIRNTKEGECDWFYHYTFAKEPESAEQ